jgi:hypothetical protein
MDSEGSGHGHKAQQLTIISPDRNDGFTRQREGKKIARLFHLIRASNYLPCFAENVLNFEIGHTCVDVPRRWNSRGFRQGRAIVVESKDFGDGLGSHGCITDQFYIADF